MTTLEGNKLIAEFMGAKKQPHPDSLYWFDIPPTTFSSHGWNDFAMEYHLRWDWLMPVVEKIEDNKYMTIIGANGIIGGHYMNIMTGVKMGSETIDNPTKVMGTGDKKINAVYSAVIQFIQWFNTQTPTPCPIQPG